MTQFNIYQNFYQLTHKTMPKISKSKLLRNIIFRRWEVEIGKKGLIFNAFYAQEMDRIIDAEKSRLN